MRGGRAVADEFDLDHAERVFVSAQLALSPGHAPDRLQLFEAVTTWLGRAVTEVKRLRVGRVALVAEALNELNALMLTQLDDAIARRGTLLEAVREFRDRNYFLARDESGHWRWTPRPDSLIHDAIEKLTTAMIEAERSVQ